ncbi:COX15/CtaA family protein [Maricaulis sp.]|uniref:COX15/CtaA family protein n=1 Tax=Maricaulis sp. TaxID=1486257 RepID=UPI0026179EEA|nr:COX15/CtaA family protein [Maricaulis sp.]
MSYRHHTRPAVSNWLFVMTGLIAIMILVGGATRLTDSGLSITEWRPITGAIPPLSQADWEEALELYRSTTEYQEQNRGMSMSEFQFIFWWEWGHRQLGRFLGLAFAVPLVFFWLRGDLSARLKPRLLGLFVLGGLQGAIGWWMVASGLVDRLDVSQYRLATHLGMAFVLLGATFWTALDARYGAPPVRAGNHTRWFLVLWGLLFVQILMGALVAGIDAGKIFNTWPGMNGQLIPDGYLAGLPFHQAIFESHAAVQLQHRWMAYVVTLAVAVTAFIIYREPRVALKPFMVILPALVVAQVALGIAALLAVAPLGLSLVHQAGAVILFIAIGAAAWTARRAV